MIQKQFLILGRETIEFISAFCTCVLAQSQNQIWSLNNSLVILFSKMFYLLIPFFLQLDLLGKSIGNFIGLGMLSALGVVGPLLFSYLSLFQSSVPSSSFLQIGKCSPLVHFSSSGLLF